MHAQGGPLQRTLSAPPLAAVQLGRPALKDCLFEFTSIFDGEGLAPDSPPPAGKRPPGGVWNIHASAASDVRAPSACMHTHRALIRPHSEWGRPWHTTSLPHLNGCGDC